MTHGPRSGLFLLPAPSTFPGAVPALPAPTRSPRPRPASSGQVTCHFLTCAAGHRLASPECSVQHPRVTEGGRGWRAASKQFFPISSLWERMEAGLFSWWGARGWGGVWKKPRAVSTNSATSPCCPRNARSPPAREPRWSPSPHTSSPVLWKLPSLTSYQGRQVGEHAPPGQTPPPASPSLQREGARLPAGSLQPGPATSRPSLGEGPGRTLGGVWRGWGENLQTRRGRRRNPEPEEATSPTAGRNVEGAGQAEVKCQAAEGASPETYPGHLPDPAGWRASFWACRAHTSAA